jgi:hypothetical protein
LSSAADLQEQQQWQQYMEQRQQYEQMLQAYEQQQQQQQQQEKQQRWQWPFVGGSFQPDEEFRDQLEALGVDLSGSSSKNGSKNKRHMQQQLFQDFEEMDDREVGLLKLSFGGSSIMSSNATCIQYDTMRVFVYSFMAGCATTLCRTLCGPCS